MLRNLTRLTTQKLSSPTQRLFSTQHSLNTFRQLPHELCPKKVDKLHAMRVQVKTQMAAAHPGLMFTDVNNRIAYALTHESPEKVIKQGGLMAEKHYVRLHYLPEAAALHVNESHLPMYLVATIASGKFIIPHNRELILWSPDAYPLLHPFYVSRQILDVKNGKLVLGEPVGIRRQKGIPLVGEGLKEFMSGEIIKPKTANDIILTKNAEILWQKIQDHYKPVSRIDEHAAPKLI